MCFFNRGQEPERPMNPAPYSKEDAWKHVNVSTEPVPAPDDQQQEV